MLRTRKYEVPPEEVEKESPVSKEYINQIKILNVSKKLTRTQHGILDMTKKQINEIKNSEKSTKCRGSCLCFIWQVNPNKVGLFEGSFK